MFKVKVKTLKPLKAQHPPQWGVGHAHNLQRNCNYQETQQLSVCVCVNVNVCECVFRTQVQAGSVKMGSVRLAQLKWQTMDKDLKDLFETDLTCHNLSLSFIAQHNRGRS